MHDNQQAARKWASLFKVFYQRSLLIHITNSKWLKGTYTVFSGSVWYSCNICMPSKGSVFFQAYTQLNHHQKHNFQVKILTVHLTELIGRKLKMGNIRHT